MTEIDKLKRAQTYMEQLADGTDPITNNGLPRDTVLNNERLSKCFAYVADVLRKVIENGSEAAKKPESEKLPFEITEEQKSGLLYLTIRFRLRRFATI